MKKLLCPVVVMVLSKIIIFEENIDVLIYERTVIFTYIEKLVVALDAYGH